MEEMEHHVRLAARALPRSPAAAYLPFKRYETVEDLFRVRVADAGPVPSR